MLKARTLPIRRLSQLVSRLSNLNRLNRLRHLPRQRLLMKLDPDQLHARVVALEIEHRDLDEAIVRLIDLPNRDDLLLTRMKKRKLQLKDQILQLKMLLVPDIPA